MNIERKNCLTIQKIANKGPKNFGTSSKLWLKQQTTQHQGISFNNKIIEILKIFSKQIQCSVHPLCLHKGTNEFRLRTLQKTPTDANLLIITVKTTATLTNCPAKLTTTTPNSIWYNPLTWLSPSDSRLLKKMIQYLKGYNNKKKKS